MKNRDSFVKKLKYFNENYFLITENDGSFDNFESRLSKEEIEYLSPLYHKLNISKISQITLEDNNCFKDFYELDDEMLFYFFEVLTKIDKALIVHDKQVSNIKEAQRIQNRNNALINKIDDILSYAENTDSRFSEPTLNDLDAMKQSLQDKHFTKRQLFESFLFHITIFLDRKKNTKKVSDITNSIIENYFNVYDIYFTKDTDVKKFTGRTYSYGYLKNLTLHHR